MGGSANTWKVDLELHPSLVQRRDAATSTVKQLTQLIGDDPEFPKIADLCIYVTGSYGRREASPFSDVDVFFVRKGSAESNVVTVVESSLLNASLIKATRKMKLPEFTKGGVYLTINYVEDILKVLGSPRDDQENFFTARMLLLLESIPICNVPMYDYAIEAMVDTYYRDYHDHETDFEPIFFVNDIQRFWKTLCLNYEHARNRAERSPTEKNKSHLKNLKLKFSRMLICYSMIISIITAPDQVKPTDIIRFIKQTPMERLISVADKKPQLATTVQSLMEDYAWFLECTGRAESAQLAWIGDRTQRDAAFGRARNFGLKIYEIIAAAAQEQGNLRYLVV